MIKKKIVPNKKIVFDDEGETIYDSKTRQSELARDYENENVGGIDIDKAKLVLREEDKFDKQRFRQKVKEKHREQKRKLKESQRKRQEQEEKDDFGEDSGDEEPDLSWLPDPDKIYGKEGDKSEEEEEMNEIYGKEDDESEEEETNEHNLKRNVKFSKKRKFPTEIADSCVKKKKNKKKKIEINDLSVNETEELALMLLKNK